MSNSNYNYYNGYNNGGYNTYNYLPAQAGNQPTTLTWTSNYGLSAYISPSVGSVSPYGSMTVYPTSGQIYTMTVYGQGGTATCVTTSYYTPPTYVPPTYTPPTYIPPTYVPLTQIPYTGFGDSAGEAINWMAIVAFAGAAAYLLFYFRFSKATRAASRA
jgi:hypothetical protein